MTAFGKKRKKNKKKKNKKKNKKKKNKKKKNKKKKKKHVLETQEVRTFQPIDIWFGQPEKVRIKNKKSLVCDL